MLNSNVVVNLGINVGENQAGQRDEQSGWVGEVAAAITDDRCADLSKLFKNKESRMWSTRFLVPAGTKVTPIQGPDFNGLELAVHHRSEQCIIFLAGFAGRDGLFHFPWSILKTVESLYEARDGDDDDYELVMKALVYGVTLGTRSVMELKASAPFPPMTLGAPRACKFMLNMFSIETKVAAEMPQVAKKRLALMRQLCAAIAQNAVQKTGDILVALASNAAAMEIYYRRKKNKIAQSELSFAVAACLAVEHADCLSLILDKVIQSEKGAEEKLEILSVAGISLHNMYVSNQTGPSREIQCLYQRVVAKTVGHKDFDENFARFHDHRAEHLGVMEPAFIAGLTQAAASKERTDLEPHAGKPDVSRPRKAMRV